MTKKQLGQLTLLNAEISRDLDRLHELKSTLAGCTSSISGLPHLGLLPQFDRTGEFMSIIAEVERQIIGRILESAALYIEISAYINTIDDPLIRQIVALRYLDNLPWREVAKSVGSGISVSGVRVMLDRYLAADEKQIEKGGEVSMFNTGFTIGFNCALRDSSLSLTAKGLYLVISSYVGMPEWKLTKRELAKVCGTNYAMDKAWSELLTAGYLKHYTARAASGAFIHRYELMQKPSASAPHAFVAHADFVTGDCRIILSSESKRDFTQIPNVILRSKRIPLAVKGLFGVVAHLINIPDFTLNPNGVQAFCIERVKRFTSIWRQLKLSGLLKQHRHPTGEENCFEYQYELLDEPDTETPYLVNHHADGSVSSERTISDYIAQASAKIKRLFGADGSQPPRKRRKNAVRKSYGLTKNTPSVPHEERIRDIREQIDADTLELHYAQGNVEMAVEALAELKYEKNIKIKNNDIPLEDRQAVVARVARVHISHFLSEKENVLARSTQNSVAYCRTVLYDYLIQQQTKDDAQPQQSDVIPLWEEIWLKQKEEIKKRRKAEEAKQSAQSVSEPAKA